MLPFSGYVSNYVEGGFFQQRENVSCAPFESEGLSRTVAFKFTVPVLLRYYRTVGDNDCFYHALNFCLKKNNCKIELTKALQTEVLLPAFRRHLETILVGQNKWADSMVIEFACRVFDVSIPVYIVSNGLLEGCIVYGEGTPVRGMVLYGQLVEDPGCPNLEFRGIHFSPLAYEEDVESQISTSEVEAYDNNELAEVGEVVDVALFMGEEEQEVVEVYDSTKMKMKRVRKRKPGDRGRTRWFNRNKQRQLSLAKESLPHVADPLPRELHIEVHEPERLDSDSRLQAKVLERVESVLNAWKTSLDVASSGLSDIKEKYSAFANKFDELVTMASEGNQEVEFTLDDIADLEEIEEWIKARPATEEWVVDRLALEDGTKIRGFSDEDLSSTSSGSGIIELMRVAKVMQGVLMEEKPSWIFRKWDEFKNAIKGYIKNFGSWGALGSGLEDGLKQVDDSLQKEREWAEIKESIRECLKMLLIQYDDEPKEDSETLTEGERLNETLKKILRSRGEDVFDLANQLHEQMGDLEDQEALAVYGKDLMERISATALLNFPVGNLLIERDNPDFATADVTFGNFRDCLSVETKGNEMIWTFTEPDDFSLYGSTIKSRKEAVHIAMSHKVRHELVCGAVSSANSDVTLGSMWPKSSQDDDFDDGLSKLTPDFIIDKEDHVIVIEVGTHRGHDGRYLLSEYKKKVDRYESALLFRATESKKIIFVPIIVGVNQVLSGVPLGQDIVNDLLIRMSIGSTIEDLAIEKGINASSRGKDTAKEAVAANIMHSIQKTAPMDPIDPNDGKHRIFITKEYINKIKTYRPDMDVVKKIYSGSFRRALFDVKAPPLAFEAARDELIRKIKTPAKDRNGAPIPFRTDRKAIAMVPLIDAKVTEMSKIPDFHTIEGHPGNTEIAEIWDTAMDKFENENWEDEDREALLNQAFEKKECDDEDLRAEQKKARRRYHRVHLGKLDPATKKYLARDGVEAKSHQNDQEHKHRMEQQKRAFDFETDVSDIEEFINSKELFENSEEPLNQGEREVLDLLDEANKLAGNQQLTREMVTEWMSTRWYRSLNIITDLATELTISIKQNVRKGEMILKKLSYYDVYVLIKPTNSDSHIFYSIYMPQRKGILFGEPFRKMFRLGKGYGTDFCSTRSDKLVNYLNCAPRFLTIVAFFADFYGLDVRNPQECIANDEFTRMVNFSMLVSLENKAASEECITLTRYMYMEIFKTQAAIIKPDPFKVLAKFPTVYRSRLALYILKKILINFEKMSIQQPRVELVQEAHDQDCDDSVPGDRWSGLLNCFTGGSISSSSSAVQLMYIGYFKDKQEKAQKNTEANMVYKIVEAEVSIDPEDPGIRGEMRQLPERGRGSKNFSLDCIVYGTDMLRDRLKREMGNDWRSTIVTEILRKLTTQLTHEIATLKASCLESHEDVNRETSEEDKKDAMRCKVLEALAADVESFGVNPMTKLDDILRYIETTSSGVICDLFKKCQHGGLREIYVLTIRSRLIQLAVETFSRVICSQIPEETLTHPENKLRTLDEHKKKCQRYAEATNQSVINLCSSSDKTTWNQEFTMAAMCVPLIRLLPEEFHGFIQRALNLWANKLIKLPSSVLVNFEKNIELSNPTYQLVRKEYQGIERTNIGIFRKKRSPFLNLTSGMMQGILHYTSSLLHLTFLTANKALMMTAYYKSFHCKNKILATSVCSSDDSATIVSMFHQGEEHTAMDRKSYIIATVLMQTATHFCRAFCMVESVKSTIGALNTVEFNSEFILQNTLASPFIKYVAAMLNFTQSQSHIKASHERYNLMSAAFQNGFPALSTHFCQVAQLILHYKALGSGSNILFSDFKRMIKDFPDPTHGFFLMDTERAPGFAGFSFCIYKAITNGAPQLGQSLKFLSKVEPEAGPDGVSVQSLNIKHGNLERWVKLIDRVCDGSVTNYSRSARSDAHGRLLVDRSKLREKISIINEDPKLFLIDPVNEFEVRIKLIMKAASHGVSDSLTRGNPMIQAFAATSYGLFAPCYVTTTLTRQTSGEELEKITRKLSLLRSLKDQIERVDSEQLDQIDLETHFPLMQRYKEFDEIVVQYAEAEEINCRAFRKKKSFLNFGSSSSRLPVSLLDCLRWHWYGMDCRNGKRVVEHCLEQYKLRFPWIMTDADSTLKESPFETFSEMFGFLSHSDGKIRNFVRLGPRIKAASFAGQVHQLIRRSFKNKVILQVFGKRESREPFSDTFRDQQCKLDLALNYPVKDDRNKAVEKALEGIAVQVPSTAEEKRLHTIAEYALGFIKPEELINKIHADRLAPFICFPKEQQRLLLPDGSSKWVGEGDCVATMGSLVVRILLEGERATEIQTNDLHKLRRDVGFLRDIMNRISAKALQKVNVDYALDTEGHSISCVFSGTVFRAKYCVGTPVYYNPDLQGVLRYPKDLEVKTSYRSIGINYVERGCHPVSILIYKTRDRDLFSYSYAEMNKVLNEQGELVDQKNLVPSGKIIDNWIRVRPTHRNGLTTLCCELFKKEIEERAANCNIQLDKKTNRMFSNHHKWLHPSKEMDRDRTRIWLKDTFRKRIIELGVPTQRNFSDMIAIDEDEPVPDEELCAMLEGELRDWMIADEIGLVDIDELEKGGGEIEAIAEERSEALTNALLSAIELMDEDLEVLNYNYSVAGKVDQGLIEGRIPNAYARHPLWDNFINNLTGLNKQFISTSVQGFILNEGPLFSILVQVLMDVPSIRAVRNLEDDLEPQYDY